MMVVSSTTCSSFIHRAEASATSRSTAFFGSLAPVPTIMSMTSWFSQNSHSPSEASTIILSASVSSTWCISGSEITPAVCATVSPSERAIASPGMSMWPSHTRGGPSMPSSYSTANTRPPAARMRFFSSSRSGLWSSETSTAWILPSSPCRPRMIRESPMLATLSVSSRIVPNTAVVPENSVSILASANTALSSRATSAAMALPGSVSQREFRYTLAGSRSVK
mmetsp:Transcript_73198/g.176925  ORF Transcript_73198/g.176925 Transcript_73198/m.176925 type:complete len:223 (-) Transcript_73198:348-1016(-)